MLDRLLAEKNPSRKEAKPFSNDALPKATGELTRKNLRRKMTNFDAIIQRMNDASNAYVLDSSFEMRYFVSPEYKKSQQSFVNAKDNNGHTALHVAAFSNNMRGVKVLLKYGGCPFMKDMQDKVSPMFIE